MNTLIVGGLGIRDLEQVTLETYRACLMADLIVYLGTRPEYDIPQLKSWGVLNIRSIFELYVDGDVDTENYSRLYEAVIEASKSFSKTVLLVPGHPRIGVTLVQWLEKNRASNPFNLNIQPGVSSFDTLLNDLARDPIEKGSIILDANRMLLFDLKWDASLDCYIYHVCSVGTSRVHVSDAKKENAWDQLKAHLLTIYDKGTHVDLVSSTTVNGRASSRLSATIGTIETLFEHVHFGTTLYIPGQKPARLDRKFLARLTSREDDHVAKTKSAIS